MLAFYAIPVAVFAVLLLKPSFLKRWIVFAGFALYGLFLGIVSVYAYKAMMFQFNMPGILLGDSVYEYSIHHFGTPNSFYSHYSIPWLLREPQLFLFTSILTWGFLGAIIQLAYNLIRKPAPARAIPGVVVLPVITMFVILSAGAVYLGQDATARYGPSTPSAVSVIEISPLPVPGSTTRPPPPVTYSNTASFAAETLTLSRTEIKAGESVNVAAVVKNTGPAEGMAKVSLSVDGAVLALQNVALAADETRQVRFVLNVPRPGTYYVSLGNLSRELTVI